MYTSSSNPQNTQSMLCRGTSQEIYLKYCHCATFGEGGVGGGGGGGQGELGRGSAFFISESSIEQNAMQFVF